MVFTYRLDSDVRGHYSYSVPQEKAAKNFAEGKTKLVAWFVSNCKTPGLREEYVKKLQTFIPVDIYGECGPLKCPRNNAASCNNMLQKDYKFYLSFENRFDEDIFSTYSSTLLYVLLFCFYSICDDYVTEKFTAALQNGVVPIALGGGNMVRINQSTNRSTKSIAYQPINQSTSVARINQSINQSTIC